MEFAPVICVPYQLDVGEWGYALGPAAIADRISRTRRPERTVIELPGDRRSRDTVTNLASIAGRTSAAVAGAVLAGHRPLVLQGDCSHAVGAIGGIQRSGARTGVVWFDAHADVHTMRTTLSGYIGGMPYAVALGWDLDDWRFAAGLTESIAERAALLVGVSDVDEPEEAALARSAVGVVDANELDSDSGLDALRALLEERSSEADRWYLHVDVDVAGPDEVPGGLTPATWPAARSTILAAINLAATALDIATLGIATYNPVGDPDQRGLAFVADVLAAASG